MEIEALKGAAETIKRYNPILALSAYHKWDDLIVFTNWITDISAEYHFYLRKYGARYDSRNELVLYAVPQERLVNCTVE